MGNQREIVQVAPEIGLGVVIRVREGRSEELLRAMGDPDEQGRLYTVFQPAGEPIEVPNLDGTWISMEPQPADRVVIQSGGKMWCGYETFVEHLRKLAVYLDDAHFFVGDSECYIDELHIRGGELHYRRVHEGCWIPVAEFLGIDEHWREFGEGPRNRSPATFERRRVDYVVGPDGKVVEVRRLRTGTQ